MRRIHRAYGVAVVGHSKRFVGTREPEQKRNKGEKIGEQKKKNESLVAFAIVSPEGHVLALFPRYRSACLVDRATCSLFSRDEGRELPAAAHI